MTSLAIEPDEWRDRCARRIMELDPQITAEEARTIAADVHAFERTRAMSPEAAADFIAEQMNRPDPPRFERRSKDRPDRLPLFRSILRMLTPRRLRLA
jgi:hypothetical protein